MKNTGREIALIPKRDFMQVKYFRPLIRPFKGLITPILGLIRPFKGLTTPILWLIRLCKGLITSIIALISPCEGLMRAKKSVTHKNMNNAFVE